ncbi:MAG: DUF3089 domain-containing protein [Synergistaceae bacterium]|nr:DUF3089 domain-containing protein [Synergistaceae bacterium]
MSSRIYRYTVLSLLSLLLLSWDPILCSASSGPADPFSFSSAPAAPVYSDISSWAVTPKDTARYPVDVLFFYPTTYFDDKNWNQSIKEAAIDKKIPQWIKSQAGIFNGSANLYVPYYRQATIYVLNAPLNSNNHHAMDIAYDDVEHAFDYYMKNWNKGRPFILSGHSQGSNLLFMLLKRRFNDKTLQKQLVAAYVIGWPVTQEDLEKYPHLKMSETPDETGCIISYNTQEADSPVSIVIKGTVAVNPLTMTLTKDFVPAEKNLGAMFFTEDNVQYIPYYTGAQIIDGALIIPRPSNADLLQTSPPGFYHQYDYTFFYCNLVENVNARIKAYLRKNMPAK